MTDKELIRRALMGSQEAQQACTEKGITLPCPYCGSDKLYVDAPYRSDDIPVEMINDIDCDYDGFCISCNCGNYIEVEHGTFKDTLIKWNTRPAPPAGRCKDCISATNPGSNIVFCDYFERDMLPDDFCSCFEPKEK